MSSPRRVTFEIREDTPKIHTPPYAWKRLKKLAPYARYSDYYTTRDGWDVEKLNRKIRALKGTRRSPVSRPASPRRAERMRKTLRVMR